LLRDLCRSRREFSADCALAELRAGGRLQKGGIVRRKFEHANPRSVEYLHTTGASYILLLAALGTYLIVGILSLYFHDWRTVVTVGCGSVLLAVPFWLLRSGYFRTGNLILMAIVLVTVTTIATVGQGIHDIAIAAYPIVFIYVGLTSDRAMLALCGGFTLIAIFWLVFGDSFGWFAPVPVVRQPLDFFSLISMTILLALTALAVDLLSSNMRRSLERARSEIEERRKAEEALAKKSKVLASLYENVTEIIYDIAVEGEDRFFFQTLNPAFLKATGLEASQVVGKSVEEVMSGPSLLLAMSKYREAILNRRSVRWEETGTYPSGTKVGEVTVTPVYNELGVCTNLIGMVYDLTERTRADEALRESESRFRTLIDQAPIAIIVSRDGIGLYANKKLLEIFGLQSVEESAGRPILEGLAPQSREESEDRSRRRTIGLPVPGEFETIGLRMDGSQFPVHVTVAQVRLSDGMANIAFVTDITERKHDEEEKTKLQNQLIQAQKMESVGRLAGGVAHDFNNMLGVILGHTEIALEQVDPTHSLHESLTEIQKAAERSAHLTRQLLSFARKQAAAPRVLDLNKTVEGMLAMLERLIGEDVRLVWQPQADLWTVTVDPSQVDQMLANLCVNARDAINGVGTITIETENSAIDEAYCADHPGSMPGEYVRLVVRDDGGGMNQQTLAHLFEPFFTTKEVGKGTGLGLAMVYGIMKQNDGFIDVESEPGQGATFSIYLPRHIGSAEQPPKKGAAAPASNRREIILVVEDEPSNLKLIERMLERQGYVVLAAGTPGEAIRVAREHAGKIHLLVTDVIMPEMNGRDLARKLLSLDPRLKCLFMSGYTADVIAQRGVLDEGVSFIQKPFSIKDLSDKIRETLDTR
jgi:two-component system, cell cycle sensor histidine kinase and response regulator CckA